MSETPSNGNGYANGMTVKELVLRLEARFEQHAVTMNTNMAILQQTVTRHETLEGHAGSMAEIDRLKEQAEELLVAKVARESREDERSKIMRLVFGASIASTLAAIVSILVALQKITS